MISIYKLSVLVVAFYTNIIHSALAHIFYCNNSILAHFSLRKGMPGHNVLYLVRTAQVSSFCGS